MLFIMATRKALIDNCSGMRRFVFIAVVLACSLVAWAQQPNLEPNTPGNKPVPTVTYDQVFPGAKPAHFAVAVESDGRASYRSDEIGPGAPETATGDPYLLQFVISDATRTRIFNLAAEANYFRGNFNYTKNRIANTGTKTLTYSEGPAVAFGKPTTGVRSSTVYNYSENRAVQELTAIFQEISQTLELGRQLSYLQRFDKLGLDAELKSAEQMAHEGQLLEVQAIAPTLKAVADDTAVMHIARQRAEALLKIAQASPAATPARK